MFLLVRQSQFDCPDIVIRGLFRACLFGQALPSSLRQFKLKGLSAMRVFLRTRGIPDNMKQFRAQSDGRNVRSLYNQTSTSPSRAPFAYGQVPDHSEDGEGYGSTARCASTPRSVLVLHAGAPSGTRRCQAAESFGPGSQNRASKPRVVAAALKVCASLLFGSRMGGCSAGHSECRSLVFRG